MASGSIDVNYVANLARLKLSEDEISTFQPQMESIIGYIDKLNELDLTNIEPTAHAADRQDAIREDIARPGLEREAFLQNAPDQSQEQIRVPKVIEDI